MKVSHYFHMFHGCPIFQICFNFPQMKLKITIINKITHKYPLKCCCISDLISCYTTFYDYYVIFNVKNVISWIKKTMISFQNCSCCYMYTYFVTIAVMLFELKGKYFMCIYNIMYFYKIIRYIELYRRNIGWLYY